MESDRDLSWLWLFKYVGERVALSQRKSTWNSAFLSAVLSLWDCADAIPLKVNSRTIEKIDNVKNCLFIF